MTAGQLVTPPTFSARILLMACIIRIGTFSSLHVIYTHVPFFSVFFLLSASSAHLPIGLSASFPMSLPAPCVAT